MISKIISGGQTGADQGGLSAALILNIKTGGTAPKGYRTQAGSASWLKKLGLLEHSSSDYAPRTKQNVLDSDGTIIFGDISSNGSTLTKKFCKDLSKPYIYIEWRSGEEVPENLIPEFIQWLDSEKINILNVAGNREEFQRGIFYATQTFLVKSLQEYNLRVSE